MGELELKDIIALLRAKLKQENRDRVIVIAKDEEQLQTAMECGTIALVLGCEIIDGLDFIICLADPEGENV